MRSSFVRHGLSRAVGLFMVAALSACSTTQKMSDSSAAQISAEKMAERLGLAEKAQKAGKPEEALAELDQAARVDPASKVPWVRKSQLYFDARQYGQAITAAQEALQRDTSDLTAKSILAVSGLRVSADALEQLRKANEVNGSARTEAESVAKLIREALGEPILVPAATAETSSSTAQKKSTTRAMVRAAKPAPASNVTAVVKSAPPAAGGRSNPFGALQ